MPAPGSPRPRILHLVDDTTPGGVMRMLEFLATDPALARQAGHMIMPVPRGRVGRLSLQADLVVSHLSVNWRALPRLIALRARHPGLKIVHVEHSYTEGFTALNVPSRARFHTLLRTAYALFDRVVAVSEGQGTWLRDRGLVPGARLTVIRSVVDLTRFAALPGPQGRPRVLGAFGRLDRQKGFDTMITAFRTLPDPGAELHIFGEGSERAALEALAAEDLRVTFHGHVEDPVAAMAGVDAVLMPSRWEAYGIAALEARVAGRPLIATGIDGLRDHAGGAEVRFVPPGAVAALREAIEALGPTGLGPEARRKLAVGAVAETREGWAALIASLELRPVG
ncbi:glycosyltransferase [Pseudooceanicola sp. CBS1P-1]|uniref:Glycosyltransferase n=2 Tax=Paracoccaceae TaxID=31989 RepID=A0A6L7FZS2_9RHOB|nr:glycosyltransferase [Pseudooceanicola endophyticus]MXN16800.1 glycosyltransferase [Pseudooceanicola albus]